MSGAGELVDQREGELGREAERVRGLVLRNGEQGGRLRGGGRRRGGATGEGTDVAEAVARVRLLHDGARAGGVHDLEHDSPAEYEVEGLRDLALRVDQHARLDAPTVAVDERGEGVRQIGVLRFGRHGRSRRVIRAAEGADSGTWIIGATTASFSG